MERVDEILKLIQKVEVGFDSEHRHPREDDDTNSANKRVRMN